jgi:hypothetical protein
MHIIPKKRSARVQQLAKHLKIPLTFLFYELFLNFVADLIQGNYSGNISGRLKPCVVYHDFLTPLVLVSITNL